MSLLRVIVALCGGCVDVTGVVSSCILCVCTVPYSTTHTAAFGDDDSELLALDLGVKLPCLIVRFGIAPMCAYASFFENELSVPRAAQPSLGFCTNV